MADRIEEERARLEGGELTIVYNSTQTNFQGRWAINKVNADVANIPGTSVGPDIVINVGLRSFVVHPSDRAQLLPSLEKLEPMKYEGFRVHLVSGEGKMYSLEARGHLEARTQANDHHAYHDPGRDLISNYELLETGTSATSGSWTYIPAREEFRWSEGMYKLFGMDMNEKVRPDVYVDYSVDEDRTTAKKISQCIIDGRAFDESLRIDVEGMIKTLRVVGAPRYVLHELCVIGVDVDLTSRDDKRIVGPSYEQLKFTDKAKTAFLNNLSQELQNPMTLILESLNKVIKKSASELSDRMLNELLHAQRHAMRMEKLIKTLLDFTHLEKRRDAARYYPTDISRLTKELSAGFRPIIEKAGLTFNIECDRIPETIYLDQMIYETILFNLLSNAFKFTLQGSITVRVSDSRTHVKVSVADTGIGIIPAHQKKIFQRFTKANTAVARSLDGMGIGLPLVKELVEIHGGSISVKSQPTRGSEFTVSLPKGTAHIAPEKLGTSRSSDHGKTLRATLGEIESWSGASIDQKINEESHSGLPKVIVAESNAEMRHYIVRSLEGRYKVLETDNGQGVIDLISSGHVPDLILADASMPRMNGFELLTFIRESPSFAGLPFIVLTSRTIADEELKSLYFGADDYLVKPFNSQELLAHVESRIQIACARRKPMQSLTHQLETYYHELNEKNAKLTALNEELSSLTFAASHDLREPLRKIRLFVHRLMKEEQANLSPDGMFHFQRIQAFVNTMNDLVTGITLYANYKDSVGQISPINIEEMLTSLVEYLEPILTEKGASVRFIVSEGLKGNYEQVKQVVFNLISNALKFNKPDVPLQITITGKVVDGNSIDNERVDKGVQYYQLSVMDNGIGIDPAYTKRIFGLFRKLHQRSVYPGVGIGLTIVRRVMENHNGVVVVESMPERGSSFHCFFPVETKGS